MKRAGILTGLISMLVLHAAGLTTDATHVTGGDSRTYMVKPGHVRLTIPPDWTMIPQAELMAYREKLRELFPRRPVPNYIQAFQRKALFTFALPYVLIEIEERVMPTPDEVAQEAIRFDANVRAAYRDLHRNGQFGEVQALPAAYDPTNHVIVGYSRMTRSEDKQRIASVTAIYPCRYGYLRLYFFVAADDEARDIPAVESIITSVKFDTGYAYSASAAPKGLTRGARYALYGTVIVLATLWFGMRIMARRV